MSGWVHAVLWLGMSHAGADVGGWPPDPAPLAVRTCAWASFWLPVRPPPAASALPPPPSVLTTVCCCRVTRLMPLQGWG